MSREELKRIIQAQVKMSQQMKLMGKNLLDLTQLIHANQGRDKQESPVDSSSSTYPVSDIVSTTPMDYQLGPSLAQPTQGIMALLVEGDYLKEWATLSQNLFGLGIAQASVAGRPELVRASGTAALSRFDIVFMPADTDVKTARQVYEAIRECNYRAVFVAVTEGPAEQEHLLVDWDQWYQEVLSARASVEEIGCLINRHFQPLATTVI
jgi:hypothetical protein